MGCDSLAHCGQGWFRLDHLPSTGRDARSGVSPCPWTCPRSSLPCPTRTSGRHFCFRLFTLLRPRLSLSVLPKPREQTGRAQCGRNGTSPVRVLLASGALCPGSSAVFPPAPTSLQGLQVTAHPGPRCTVSVLVFPPLSAAAGTPPSCFPKRSLMCIFPLSDSLELGSCFLPPKRRSPWGAALWLGDPSVF